MDFSIVPNDALGIITKAELDSSIATAKSFPRDLKKFIDNSIASATLNQEIAAKCAYKLPRKDKNGNTTYIEGPSVHLARICCAHYQNIKVAVRIISNDGKTITAQGVAIDMENNYTASIEVKRRITDRFGNTYSEDLQIVTANAACAIAYRNVVFQVLPSAFISQITEKVKEVAMGNTQDLTTRRQNCLLWFKSQGVGEQQVCDLAGVFSVEEIGQEELYTLRSIQESIKSGEHTIASLLEPEVDPTVNKQSVSDMANEAYGIEGNGQGDLENPKPNKSNKAK